MTKYAISKEGAEALNQLANDLLNNANNIIETNQRLEQITSSLYDNLGIYGDEIISIIHQNRNTLNINREDIISLAQRVKKQAADVENLVSMGLESVGGSSSSPGIKDTDSWQTVAMPRVSYNNASGSYQKARDTLEKMKVEHRPISRIGQNRTHEEIVERLGGGDKTRGSCSSLAFAYAGNMAGYEVLDFRDGNSRSYFSSNNSILTIAALLGVESKVVSGRDDVACADQLLSEMKPGKEYYLATGEHASIVRKNNGLYEYLELQHPTKNGWYLLHDERLIHRFKCRDTNKVEYPNFLIDIDSLANCNEFLDLLGYINTAAENQNKGELGHVR